MSRFALLKLPPTGYHAVEHHRAKHCYLFIVTTQSIDVDRVTGAGNLLALLIAFCNLMLGFWLIATFIVQWTLDVARPRCPIGIH